LSLLTSLTSARAEPGNPVVSADDLLKDANRYLNQPIAFRGAFCYAAKHGYECRTGAPLRISAEKMPDGDAKTTIDHECGELDVIELSPGCGFTLQMVPTETTTMEGDYIRDGQRVTGRILVITVTVTGVKQEAAASPAHLEGH
jgi:hypothetical protein